MGNNITKSGIPILKRRLTTVKTRKSAVRTQQISGPSEKLPVNGGTPLPIANESACPVLHVDCLPGWIGKFVSLVCKNSEADPVTVLIMLLLRFAAEICGPFVKVGEARHPAQANAVIVGETSRVRMGTSSKPVERLFDGMDNGTQSLTAPQPTCEDIIHKVRDISQELTKKSGELTTVDQGVTDKRLFILDDKFAVTLLASTKRRENPLSTIIKGLYDGGNAVVTADNRRVTTTGAHVVIVGHTFKADLISQMKGFQMSSDFANHFLWIQACRHKLVSMPKRIPGKKVNYFREIIAKHIQAARTLTSVGMTGEALQLWDKLYPGLSAEYAGFVGSVVDRSEDHAIRLALIYALILGHEMIDVSDIKAAVALVHYSRESAFKLFNGEHGDKRKERILQLLRAAPNNEMTQTDISVKVFKGNEKSEEIKKVLLEMESAKLLHIIKVKKPGRGKPTIKIKLGSATV